MASGKILLLILLCAVKSPVYGKDLGVWGQTWEIKEQDAVEMITSKLSKMEASGEIEKQNKKIVEGVKARTLRPKAPLGISHTSKPREYVYDPSFSYPVDLKDHRGQVFYRAGTIVNPLDHITLPYELIFIDGDDKKQVSWALSKHKQAQIKPVITLIKGEPVKLSELHKIEIYFDQFGSITKKFDIKQVPAFIKQEGKVLKIRELKLSCKKEQGEEICQEA
jgi:conjugal transfer pilus assembly protein TraW